MVRANIVIQGSRRGENHHCPQLQGEKAAEPQTAGQEGSRAPNCRVKRLQCLHLQGTKASNLHPTGQKVFNAPTCRASTPPISNLQGRKAAEPPCAGQEGSRASNCRAGRQQSLQTAGDKGSRASICKVKRLQCLHLQGRKASNLHPTGQKVFNDPTCRAPTPPDPSRAPSRGPASLLLPSEPCSMAWK